MQPLEQEDMVIASRRSKQQRIICSSSRNPSFVLLGSVTLLILLIVWGSQQQQSLARSGSTKAAGDSSSPQGTGLMTIEGGSTKGGVEYYHCTSGLHGASQQQQHLILLHGSRFTKEDWKTSGILQQFCRSPSLSVIALDLSVQADHEALLLVLNDLKATGTIDLPIAGLVTPSASGRTVLQGISSGSLAKLTAAIQRWIPVACNALLSVKDPSTSLAEAKSWPILAVYGDRDAQGKRSSELLVQMAGATIKELPGRHPCYLDSPDEFVQTVLDFMASKK